jgi:hypothetical protein
VGYPSHRRPSLTLFEVAHLVISQEIVTRRVSEGPSQEQFSFADASGFEKGATSELTLRVIMGRVTTHGVRCKMLVSDGKRAKTEFNKSTIIQ